MPARAATLVSVSLFFLAANADSTRNPISTD
jgi:hypothetical protein